MNIVFLLFLISIETDFFNIKVNSDENPVLPFHNEEQIVVNPVDSLNLVAVWRDFRTGYRQIGIGVSLDGGITWEDRLLTGSGLPYDSDPGLTVDTEGNFYLVSLSFKAINDTNALIVFKSSDKGFTFTKQGNAVFSNGVTFEDKELIACDRTDSEYRGNLYVVWTRFISSATIIYFVYSEDQGITWSDPIQVSDNSGNQWPVPCVGKDGTVYVGWVGNNYSAILLDRSFDGGKTWGDDIFIRNVIGYDKLDGWIGVFSYPAMDADITDGPYSGNLYIAYCNIGFYGSSDIYFIRSQNRGETWSEPVVISGVDTEPDNDQFHPWLTVDNTGIIHVIFYDQRNGISDDLVDIYYTKSDDGGETWSEPERVTEVASKPRTINPPLLSSDFEIPENYLLGEIYGEYIGLTAWNGQPFPVWTDCREDGVENVYVGYRKEQGMVNNSSYGKDNVVLSFVEGELKVEFSSCERGNYLFTLYNLYGTKIASIEKNLYYENDSFVWIIDNLSKGVYFVKIDHGNKRSTKKIVKVY